MSFLDSLKAIFSGDGERATDKNTHWIYVRCHRCGETIMTRLDLQNSLNPLDEGGYIARKTLVGNQLCFERIEVTLTFDERKRLVAQEAMRGDLITAEEFETTQK